jgi:hypothetical protein
MAEQFFTVDSPDGSRLEFSSFDEIDTWLEKERAAQQWLDKGGQAAGGEVDNLRNSRASRYAGIRKRLDNWRADPESAHARQNLSNAFTNLMGDHTFVGSGHPFVLIASDIAIKDGPVAASAALGTLLGVPCNPSTETIKGTLGAILRRDGIEPTSPQIVSNAIQELNASATTTSAKQRAEWDALKLSATSQLDGTKTSFEQQTVAAHEKIATTIERINSEVNNAIFNIQATEAGYKTQMQLQAPVDYWNTKATAHREAITGWFGSRSRLIYCASIGSLILIVVLLMLATSAVEIAERAKGDTAIYLKFAAIGAIITTIVFWISRVLLRIYLSDRHLLTDAEERVAMIKTYLALSNEGKVEAVDRALILAPLFRSASDGIVKDEGPDASVAGVLAKLLDVRGGR